ncbi:hypothetical protein DPX16_23323 [Anabarilius grahami]|uniref:Uncharacterized protein n=1 Tax=Anabarilius grahami TaxID=495550 RepID=A0A3N0XEV5_ANAGA|nr:hypothetical protein DPX16_23323 [Anabarilius grahami]
MPALPVSLSIRCYGDRASPLRDWVISAGREFSFIALKPLLSYISFGSGTFNIISLTRNIHSNTQRAALERKRSGSGGDPLRTSKRVFVGRGKPRGRRGGRRQASATVTHRPVECSLSSSVEVPSEILNPQEEFEKNMERLHVLLLSLKEALLHHGLFGSRRPQSAGKRQDHTIYNALSQRRLLVIPRVAFACCY